MKKELDEIKKQHKLGKLVLGAANTLKKLRRNRLSKIWLTLNVSEKVTKDIQYLAQMSKTEVVNLKIPNDELGVLCKKNFSISVASKVKA